MPEPAGGPRSGAPRAVGSALGAVIGVLLTGGVLTGALLAGQGMTASAAASPATAGPAAAGASSGAGAGPAAPAGPPAGVHTLCRLTDHRLPELSGLAVSGNQLLAMNDGGDQLTVYALDSSCRVIAVRSAAVDPYDPEDLAVAADGTVWFADTGDNRADRATVALLALRPNGSAAVFRMTYPDGPHDAESLLLAPDGTPYVVTKELLGASGVYRPAAALVEGGTVPLARTGTVTFAPTGTAGGPVGVAGQLLATGGAVSRDGRFVALRTYTDAYVWSLTGSDVPAALAGKATRIPLPPSPQGEAIAFGSDGRSLVVAGETLPSDVTVVPLPASLLAVPASAAVPGRPTAPVGAVGVPALTAAVIAACVATAVVWLGSALARFRRRGRTAPKS